MAGFSRYVGRSFLGATIRSLPNDKRTFAYPPRPEPFVGVLLGSRQNWGQVPQERGSGQRRQRNHQRGHYELRWVSIPRSWGTVIGELTISTLHHRWHLFSKDRGFRKTGCTAEFEDAQKPEEKLVGIDSASR